MNYILAAIFANISLALTDNLSGLLSKRNKPLQLAFWSSLISLAIFFIPAITIYSDEFSKLTIENVALISGLSLLINFGFLCFITSMKRGSITLSGVIATSYPALTTILAVIFFGEKIGILQIIAITIVVVGVSMSSMSGKAKNMLKDIRTSGTLFALVTLVLWGTYSAFIRIPVEQVGWFLPEYILCINGAIVFVLISFIAKSKTTFKRPKLIIFLILSSIFTFAGGMFYNYALSKGPTSIVAPIAGSSPAIFVIIAYFLFHEKLNKKQWAGILLTVIGIIGLSLLSS